MNPSPEQILLLAYDRYADALFRFCFAQTADRERARDAMQDTFVRTWKYLASGRQIEQIRPFLYRTARNALIDSSRRPGATSLDALRDGGFDIRDARTPTPDISAEAARAATLVATLEPRYREAVTLRYIEEMTPQEIAPILGLSVNATSVRIHRGLEQLRQRMDTEHTP